MSWWDSLKSKLPEGVRQLPFQTSSYFSGGSVASTDSAGVPRTIELSSSIKTTRENSTDEYDFQVEFEEEEKLEKAISTKLSTTFKEEELTDTPADGAMEGWLAKQTVLSTTVNHTPWRNRYFILKRGCLFYYSVEAETTIQLENFKVEQDNSLPVQLEGTTHIGYLVKLLFDVPISGQGGAKVAPQASVPKPPDTKQPVRVEGGDPLSATVQNNPVSPALSRASQQPASLPAASDPLINHRLILAAESERERNEWLDVFHAIIEGTPEKVEKRGWLLGFDTYLRRWRPHYLTIKGRTLEYHNREKKGYFPLTQSELWSIDAFSFSIRAGGKVLNVSAASQEERDTWVRAISKATAQLEHEAQKGTKKILENTREIIDYSNQLRDYIEPELKATKQLILENEEKGIKPPTQGSDGKYRILCFDGGGMRGIINCIIFDRLLGIFPDMLSKINFFVGTSNGGILAMAFALGFSPNTARTLVEKSGKMVFKKKETTMPNMGINTAKFSPLPLKIICDEMAEKITLGQVPKHVLVPAFLMDNFARDPAKRSCEIRFYHNLPRSDDSYNSMMNELASDVIMRTIAAPTYFPSYQNHVDGGMFAHDPASSALTLVMSPNYLNKNKEDIILLSFGTGKVNHYYEDENHDWGYVQWVPKLTNVLWDGMIMHSEHICKELLGDRYLRFNPLLDHEISLDDPMEIPLLVETAKNLDLSPIVAFIRKHFYSE